MERATTARDRGAAGGRFAAICGALAVASVAWAALVGLTSLDPPEWLRVLGSSVLPFGIVLGVTAGIQARCAPGRVWGSWGIGLALVAVLGPIALRLSVD